MTTGDLHPAVILAAVNLGVVQKVRKLPTREYRGGQGQSPTIGWGKRFRDIQSPKLLESDISVFPASYTAQSRGTYIID
jgi:hypothetical protein